MVFNEIHRRHSSDLGFPIFQQTIKRQIAKQEHASHIYVFKLGFESAKQEYALCWAFSSQIRCHCRLRSC
jgi:hypothetical protein